MAYIKSKRLSSGYYNLKKVCMTYQRERPCILTEAIETCMPHVLPNFLFFENWIININSVNELLDQLFRAIDFEVHCQR